MRSIVFVTTIFLLSPVLQMRPAFGQVPGVDPIRVERFKSPALRGGQLGPKGPAITGRDGVYMSPGGEARMARFNAKIMTLDNIVEDSNSDYATNVPVTTYTDERSKVCVMDIGSASASNEGFSRFGPVGDAAQPVLIRGNVINICK